MYDERLLQNMSRFLAYVYKAVSGRLKTKDGTAAS